MNVLEKIFEEIEEARETYSKNRDMRFVVGADKMANEVKEIIVSHMNEVEDMHGKRLIDANALDDEVINFFLAITGNPKQTTVVRECKESFRKMIDEQPTIYANDGWIPVEEKLPEEKTEVLCCFENGTVQSLWQNWKNDGLGEYFR